MKKLFVTSKKQWIVNLLLVSLLVLMVLKLAHFKSDDDLKGPIRTSEYDIVFGADTALVTIYMYSSYNCSFCTRFFNEEYPRLKKDYIDSGKVRFVVKPLVFGNDLAVKNATQAAVCVNKYGTIEKYHQLLIYEPNVVYTKEFKQLLDDYINDNVEIAECLLTNEDFRYLNENMEEFRRLELTGTPTFIIGDKIYTGYQDFDKLDKVINDELME